MFEEKLASFQVQIEQFAIMHYFNQHCISNNSTLTQITKYGNEISFYEHFLKYPGDQVIVRVV